MDTPSSGLWAAQYEEIGASIARVLRQYEANPATEPKFLAHAQSFLRKYQAAPLFLIGLSESFRSYFDELHQHGDILEHFQLPYPTMVLNFPESIFPARPHPCVVFIDTIKEGLYYIEQLHSRKGRLALWNNLSPEDQRDADKMEYEKPEATEGAAMLVRYGKDTPADPDCAFSGNFIHDCDAKPTPLYWVNGYCTFSVCDYLGGSRCPAKTATCEGYVKSARQVLMMVCYVLSYINRPDRYVVKVATEKTSREMRLSQKGRVASFAKKDLHIVLDCSQVREIFAASRGGTTHSSPLPHQRRGHWRELRAECFRQKGKIWVRPADINKGLQVKVKKSIYEIL